MTHHYNFLRSAFFGTHLFTEPITYNNNNQLSLLLKEALSLKGETGAPLGIQVCICTLEAIKINSHN